MQARFKHHIARFSQGERRRARFEQARLIALHTPEGARIKPPRLYLAVRIALWAYASLLLALLAAVLSGCSLSVSNQDAPPGVQLTDDERQACAAHSCTVWTPVELQELVRRVFRNGYDVGVKSI